MVHHYWDWAGSNIGAMPAEFLITLIASAIFTIVFRKPLMRLATRVRGWFHHEHDAALAAAREDAAKSRMIAADLYRHVTGEDHIHAPSPQE